MNYFGQLVGCQKNNIDVANVCSSQDSIRKIQSMGRCNSAADRFICTSDKSGCRFAAVFQPLATDCNLVQDFYPSNEFSNAHYGLCMSEQGEVDWYAGKSPSPDATFCTWKLDECKGLDLNGEKYSWRTADTGGSGSVPDCHCDDVETGACYNIDTNDQYCAVSTEACGKDIGYSYLPVFELKSQLNITCKLCDTIPPELYIKEIISSGDEVDNTTSSGDESLNAGITDNTTSSEASVDEKSSNEERSVVTGIVIGSILGVIVLLGIGCFSLRLRSKKEAGFVRDDPSVSSFPSVA